MTASVVFRSSDDQNYNYVVAEFSIPLHNRESDFTLEPSTGYSRQPGEPLLAVLVQYLLTDNSDVWRIQVKASSLVVHYDRAVSQSDIQSRILTACLHASGLEPVTSKWLA